MVPGHLVPHNWSPIDWSLWTNSPQPISPHGQTVPNQFCPHGQMVPKNLVPMDKWSPTNLVPLDKWSLEYSVCPGGQAVMIWKYGTKLVGDHLSMETKCLGIICPWGPNVWRPFVHGDQLWWGPFVQGDQIGWEPFVHGDQIFGTTCPCGQEVGDQKSGDQMGSGPNESQPIIAILNFFNHSRSQFGKMGMEFFFPNLKYFRMILPSSTMYKVSLFSEGFLCHISKLLSKITVRQLVNQNRNDLGQWFGSIVWRQKHLLRISRLYSYYLHNDFEIKTEWLSLHLIVSTGGTRAAALGAIVSKILVGNGGG